MTTIWAFPIVALKWLPQNVGRSTRRSGAPQHAETCCGPGALHHGLVHLPFHHLAPSNRKLKQTQKLSNYRPCLLTWYNKPCHSLQRSPWNVNAKRRLFLLALQLLKVASISFLKTSDSLTGTWAQTCFSSLNFFLLTFSFCGELAGSDVKYESAKNNLKLNFTHQGHYNSTLNYNYSLLLALSKSHTLPTHTKNQHEVKASLQTALGNYGETTTRNTFQIRGLQVIFKQNCHSLWLKSCNWWEL